MITNCPNCGAALKNKKCEYCGTELQVGTDDMPIMSMNEWRKMLGIPPYEDKDDVLVLENFKPTFLG